jgi:hypothetical protein
LNKEVEILKIGSIIPTEGRDTIMVVFDGGTIFDHYVSILKEKCGDEYKYLKTQQSIVGTPSDRPDRFSRFDKPSNTLKVIQNKEPKIGESYGVVNWYTSTVNKIIDDNILITRNSVYAIHDISKLRDKILNDLGIN